MIPQILNFVAAFVIGWVGIGAGFTYWRTAKTAYVPLSKKLVEAEIYDEKAHKQIANSLYIGSCIMVFGGVALLVWAGLTGNGMTWLMGVLGILVGLFKGRNATADPRRNAQNFARTRAIYMDQEKAKAYFAKHYDL